MDSSYSKQKTAFGTVYLPHESGYGHFLDNLDEAITEILPICDELIILGDFNINVLDPNASSTEHLFSMLDSYGLTQIINSPTRVSRSSTLIDLIIVSGGVRYTNVLVLDASDISDHHLVSCDVCESIPTAYPFFKKIRDFSRLPCDEFEFELISLDWDRMIYMQSIDEKVSYFNECLMYLLEKYVPEKTLRITRPPAPWLTPTLRLMMRDRDRAFKRFKRTRSDAHKDYYRTLRNWVTFATRREKKAYINAQFDASNSRTMWQRYNDLLGTKNKNNLSNNISDPNKINEHFMNSVPSLPIDDSLLEYYNSNRRCNFNELLEFRTVSVDEILILICNIKSRAVGIDNISIKFLFYCLPFIAPYIAHIINSCLLDHSFPNQWKQAIVIPLPKVPQPTAYHQLRPVSILPALSKVLERIVDNQVRQHFKIYNLLPDTQSGFRAGYSCDTALLNITDDVLTGWDKRLHAILVGIDYSKAFDMINHELLLSILKYMGMGEGVCAFFAEYLKGRSQRVMVEGHLSEARQIVSGCPQGAICSPIIYTAYTACFKNYIKYCGFHAYADDTQLTYSFDYDARDRALTEISRDIDMLVKISRDHGLIINPDKSAAIIFGNKNNFDTIKREVPINIDGVTVAYVDEIKSLGLKIDSDLKFKSHIDAMIRSSYGILRVLFANKSVLNQRSRLLLSNALILSRFNHCDTVYGPCISSEVARRIQRVQNSCLRFSYGIRKYERISHTLLLCGWLDMESRRRLHAAALYSRVIGTKCPQYLFAKITFRTDVHHLNLRRRNLITVPIHRAQLFKRSFTYCVASLWNSLPSGLKLLSVPAFKRSYRAILSERQMRKIANG